MSESSLQLPLSVTWVKPDPPIPARDMFQWPILKLDEASELEKLLGWPGGTLQVLHKAFELQLSRTNGWKIPAASRQPPFHAAARVYKRGVATKDQALSQTLGHYLINFLPSLDWQELMPDDQICIIDQKVAELYQLKPRSNRIFIRLDEQSKNLASVAQLIGEANKTGLKTPWTIIGGGILADTAAFAAALDQQSFRLIPTTLVAMVDACIGGKTGVNFPPYGKNQVGLFAFPTEVLISTDWLQTLPTREFLAGLAESWKHAVLKGDQILAAQVAELDRKPLDLQHYLRELVAVKAEVVAKDPTEQGLRASLNLGHTLAHAIERISQDKNPQSSILHGEAVGVGLLFCIDLSYRLGHLPRQPWAAMRQQLLDSRMILSPDELKKFICSDDLSSDHLIAELLTGIKQDKKNVASDGSEWILLEDWGKVVSNKNRFTIKVSDTDWIRCYKEFIADWTTRKV